MVLDDDSPQVIIYRLSALEKKVDDGQHRVEGRLETMQSSINNLAFVRADVYASESKAMRERVGHAEDKAAGASKLALWAIATMLVIFFSMLGLVLKVAG